MLIDVKCISIRILINSLIQKNMQKLSFLGASVATFLSPDLLNEVLSIVTQLIILLWTLISLLRRKKPQEQILDVVEQAQEKIENVKSKIKQNG